MTFSTKWQMVSRLFSWTDFINISMQIFLVYEVQNRDLWCSMIAWPIQVRGLSAYLTTMLSNQWIWWFFHSSIARCQMEQSNRDFGISVQNRPFSCAHTTSKLDPSDSSRPCSCRMILYFIRLEILQVNMQDLSQRLKSLQFFPFIRKLMFYRGDIAGTFFSWQLNV